MIKYTLKCKNSHQFESWFANSKSFEELIKRRQIECPVCSTQEIKKSLMAPRIAKESKEKGRNLLSTKSDLEKEIDSLKEKIRNTATDVGEDFPSEARAMHYGEKQEKPIVGKTTLAEARELAEEGVPFIPLPWNDEKTN